MRKQNPLHRPKKINKSICSGKEEERQLQKKQANSFFEMLDRPGNMSFDRFGRDGKFFSYFLM